MANMIAEIDEPVKEQTTMRGCHRRLHTTLSEVCLGILIALAASPAQAQTAGSGGSGAGANLPAARLRIEQPARAEEIGAYRPKADLKTERAAYVVPLSATTTWVELTPGMQRQAATRN